MGRVFLPLHWGRAVSTQSRRCSLGPLSQTAGSPPGPAAGGEWEITLRRPTSSGPYLPSLIRGCHGCQRWGWQWRLGALVTPHASSPKKDVTPTHCTRGRTLHPNGRHLASAEWLLRAKYFSIHSLSSLQTPHLAGKETETQRSFGAEAGRGGKDCYKVSVREAGPLGLSGGIVERRGQKGTGGMGDAGCRGRQAP